MGGRGDQESTTEGPHCPDASGHPFGQMNAIGPQANGERHIGATQEDNPTAPGRLCQRGAAHGRVRGAKGTEDNRRAGGKPGDDLLRMWRSGWIDEKQQRRQPLSRRAPAP